MAWPPALPSFALALAVAACCGVLVLVLAVAWRTHTRRTREALRRRSGPLPRVQLRSQVIIIDPRAGLSDEAESEARSYESSPSKPPSRDASRPPVAPASSDAEAAFAASVHSAPTREFAAHMEELAALSMRSAETRELSAYEPPTREFAAHLDEPAALRHVGLPPASRAASERVRTDSGFQPRARVARREEDATLRVEHRNSEAPSASSKDELLRMLGPSPTPDLGNIEIYYRLGLVYLASGNDAEARRCFLTVESISPGYRDASVHLAQLPFYAPTSSGATPVHYVVSADVPSLRGESSDGDSTRGRRNGR